MKTIIVYCHFREDGVLLSYCKYAPAGECQTPRVAHLYPGGSIRLI